MSNHLRHPGAIAGHVAKLLTSAVGSILFSAHLAKTEGIPQGRPNPGMRCC